MVRQIYLSPQKEWEVKRVLEGPFLVIWKVKEEEGRSAFRLAGFCHCNLIHNFDFLSELF